MIARCIITFLYNKLYVFFYLEEIAIFMQILPLEKKKTILQEEVTLVPMFNYIYLELLKNNLLLFIQNCMISLFMFH